MRTLPKIKLVTLVLLATPAILSAVEELETSVRRPQFNVTDHLLFSNRRDTGAEDALPSNLLMHEDTIHAEYEPFNANVQFSNRFRVGGREEATSPFTLEKKNITLDSERWEVIFGDSHQELGKGIALSLYRDELFGINNTLEGISVRYRPEKWDGQIFGGRVNSLKSPVALNPLENPLINRSVYLAGTGVKVSIDENTKFSGHYFVGLNQVDNSTRFNKSWHTLGGSFTRENIFGGVDGYFESSVLLSQVTAGGKYFNRPTGYGNLATLTWAPAPWTAKFELKDYRDYHFDFRRPPTLEDDVVETLNTEDVTGGRFQVSRKFPSNASATGSFLGGYDWLANAPLYHGLGAMKLYVFGKSSFEAKSGYRSIPGHNNLAHASLKTRVPTGHGEAVELEYRKQYAHNKLDVLPVTDDRNVWGVTYTFSERLNAGAGYEFVPTNEDGANHFFNLQATYKDGGLTAKAFVGQTSGGTLCSGGVCRQVPRFTGAMLETTYSF